MSEFDRSALVWNVARSIAFVENKIGSGSATNLGGDRAYQLTLIREVTEAVYADRKAVTP